MNLMLTLECAIAILALTFNVRALKSAITIWREVRNTSLPEDVTKKATTQDLSLLYLNSVTILTLLFGTGIRLSIYLSFVSLSVATIACFMMLVNYVRVTRKGKKEVKA